MNSNDERPLRLDFRNLERDRIRRKEAIPVRMRKVSSVIVEFEDGSVEKFDPPVGAAFLRERYTWEQEEGSRKVLARLDITEIYWAIRSFSDGPTGPSKAIRREGT
jgi:hypothetical protein